MAINRQLLSEDAVGLIDYREDFTNGADGTRLFWRVCGPEDADTPALICCDGIGCDGYAWKYLVRDFGDKHRILRWHYRGHGQSDAPSDLARVTFDDLCDDLAAVMNAAGITRGILLGHSMGVQVALEFHRRQKDRVQGLVLLCGSHGLPLDTFRDSDIAKKIFPLVAATFEGLPVAGRAVWSTLIGTELAFRLAMRFELNGEFVHRDDFFPYLQHLSQMDPRVFVGILRHAAEHSAFDHLPNVDVPTLVIAGERDNFTPARLSREMQARIPGGELLMIPAGTHTAPIEMPDLVTLRFEKWLLTHFSQNAKYQAA